LGLKSVCKNGQHNGSKPQTLKHKSIKMLIPVQPGRASTRKRRGTLVLNLQAKYYRKQKLKRSKNIKSRRPYLAAKRAKTENSPIK
jgi:hypothetical protein